MNKQLFYQNRAAIIGLVISAIMITSVYFFLYVPKSREHEYQRERLQELLTERDTNEQMILRVPTPDLAIEELRERISRLKEQASSKEEIPRIVQQLAGKAAEMDVAIVSIMPRDDLKAGMSDLPEGVTKVFIEVRLESLFRDFGDYLGALGDLPMKFTVEDLMLEKDSESVHNVLRIRLVVSTYVLA